MPEIIPIRRRMARRYGKNGSITLRRVVSAPVITGSLFDLSLGGCLIWLDWEATFDPSEMIEVRLQTDDVTLRVMGSVRHTAEENRLIGVEFVHLPAQDARDLEQFIAKLETAADREALLTAY